jgi:hypothetical protein
MIVPFSIWEARGRTVRLSGLGRLTFCNGMVS